MTIEHLEPLYCIGESHCLRFRDRVGRHAALLRPVHARAQFLTNVEASNFVGDGGLHPQLAAALLSTGLCVERPMDDGSVELEAAHRPGAFVHRVFAARHAALADEPLVAPALLLFAGDKEALAFAARLGGTTDFDVPDNPGYERVAGAHRVPYDTVEAALTSLLQPFFEGIEMLRSAGFTRTMVHGLLPRVRDDARAARWNRGTVVPAAVRSKVALTMNRLLALRCAGLGVGFVDVWHDLQREGYLAARFDLDGVHGNAAATEATFVAVASTLVEVSRGDTNPAQYELLGELAAARAGVLAPHDPDVEAAAWSIWSADEIGAQPPRGTDPAALWGVLSTPSVLGVLAHGWRHDPGVIQVRRKVGAAGASHELAAVPTGARRAIWVSRGAIRVNSARAEVLLSAGEMLVVGAQPVAVRVADGAEWSELTLLPRLPGEELRVLVACAAAPPADPFWIRAPLGLVHPPVSGGVLRRWVEVPGRTVEVESAVPAPEPEAAGIP